MTCWRRLREWQTASVQTKFHRVLLERLSDTGHEDWNQASLNTAAVAANRGMPRSARTLRITVKPGAKRHLLGDRRGSALAARPSPANWRVQHDVGTRSG
ncbi:hypothetical protein GCM10017322_32790 [Paracoccus aerius]|nr:hypothetical protein GCM10017322_32790 [Paracoccus aerius]